MRKIALAFTTLVFASFAFAAGSERVVMQQVYAAHMAMSTYEAARRSDVHLR